MVSIPKAQIRLFKKTGEGVWSGSYTTYDLSGLELVEALDVNRDMFRIIFDNQKNQFSGVFAVDDRISIYLYRGATPTSADLIFDGLLIEMEFDLSNSGRTLTLRGANRTQELLGSLVLIVHTDNSKKVHEAIQEIIDQVNNNNQAADPTNQRHISTTGTVAQTKSGGGDFPIRNFIVNYKTAYDAVSQFSDNEFTDDGQYVFYIDSDNKFNWQPKSTSPQSGYNFVEGSNIEDLNVQRGNWEVINSVIADVGRDGYGHGNHTLVINATSILSNGAKWKFLDLAAITPNLLEEEFNATPGQWASGDEGERTANFPTSYPYTFQFEELDSNNQETGSSWTVNDEAEFNTAIRRRARFEGRRQAQDFLMRRGTINYRATAVINGTNDFEKGPLATITSPTAEVTALELRITDVSHSFSKAGWVTKLKFEEDIL